MGQISFTLVPCVAGTYEPGKTSNNTVKLFLASQFNDEMNFYATAPEGLRSNEMNRAAFVAGLDCRLDSRVLDLNDPIFIPQVSSSDKLWHYEVGIKGQ